MTLLIFSAASFSANKTAMAKKQSIVPGFEAAYGTIIIVPDKNDHSVSGMAVPVKETELPSGTVVAVGTPPRQFWSHPLKIGSRAVYARASANQIKLPVNGEETVCKAITWSDLRGWYQPESGSPGGESTSHGKKSFWRNIKTWMYAVGGTFVAGFVAGVLVSPVVLNLSKLKFWLRKTFRRPFAGRRDGT